MRYNISKFWHRILAFLLDTIILMVFGFIIGFIFKDFFISIGNIGLLFGLVIAVTYFSLLNSKLFNGHTFGKRALKIQVVDENGQFISIKKSLARALIICLPYFVVNIQSISVEGDSILLILIKFISFSILFGFLLIYILNKYSRQSIHDLIVGTYVTSDKLSDEVSMIRGIRPWIFYVYGGIVIIVFGTLVLPSFFGSSTPDSFETMSRTLSKIEGVRKADLSVNSRTYYGSRVGTTKSFVVNLWTDENCNIEESVKTSKQILPAINIVLSGITDPTEFDFISINLVKRFDIGIARYTSSKTFSKSPEEWRKIIEN